MGKLSRIEGVKRIVKEPIWIMESDPITIDLSVEHGIEVVRLDYGHALKEDNIWIPLKQGVSPLKKVYRVATFYAISNWTSPDGTYSIKQGDLKAFAI